MMKILTLIAFLLFGFASFGQVQFSLSSHSVQSHYIDEWQKHKTIEGQCVNSGYEDVLVWFRSILYFNDTI